MSENKDPIDRVLDKLDSIDIRLNDIDKTLVRNTVSLEDHMRRTELLEQSQTKLEDKIRPLINVHITAVMIAKVLGVIGVIAGIVKLFL